MVRSESCAQRFAKGVYDLGLMYDYGRGGLAQDHDKARIYFKTAADLGYSPAGEVLRRLDASRASQPAMPADSGDRSTDGGGQPAAADAMRGLDASQGQK